MQLAILLLSCVLVQSSVKANVQVFTAIAMVSTSVGGASVLQDIMHGVKELTKAGGKGNVDIVNVMDNTISVVYNAANMNDDEDVEDRDSFPHTKPAKIYSEGIKGKIEERNYPGVRLACSSFTSKLSSNDMKELIEEADGSVREYLAGANNLQINLNQNLPVFYRMSKPPYPSFSFRVCYWLKEQDDKMMIPLPTSDRVQIVTQEPTTFYVRKFTVSKEEKEGKGWGVATMQMEADLDHLGLYYDKSFTFGATLTLPGTKPRVNEVMFQKL